jgi:hypothetical protein
MAEKQTYKLTAPNGQQVTVVGAGRRDTLLARGYTETKSSKSSSKTDKSSEG